MGEIFFQTKQCHFFDGMKEVFRHSTQNFQMFFLLSNIPKSFTPFALAVDIINIMVLLDLWITIHRSFDR